MTRDQFTLYASALIRHLLTLGAGLLAARGLLTQSDATSSIIAASALFIATVGWSFVQKNKLLKALCAAIQLDPTVVQPPSAAAPSTAAPAPGANLSPTPGPDVLPLTEEVTQP